MTLLTDVTLNALSQESWKGSQERWSPLCYGSGQGKWLLQISRRLYKSLDTRDRASWEGRHKPGPEKEGKPRNGARTYDVGRRGQPPAWRWGWVLRGAQEREEA